MHYTRRCALGLLGDKQGVALPIALFGLIIVTVLITGILLTSSTEVAVSGAHQDATAQLYTVESAVEDYVSYIADNNTGYSMPTTAFNWPTTNPRATITVSQLYYRSNGAGRPDDYTYSITATPIGGGRTISAMTMRTGAIMQFSELIPLWVAKPTSISGDHTTIRDHSPLCVDGDTARSAIEYTANSGEPKLNSDPNIFGDINETSVRPGDYVEATFGMSLGDFEAKAKAGGDPWLYFGPTQFNPGPGGINATSSNGQVDADGNAINYSSHRYNWGCPADMGPCPSTDSDTSRLPWVVIDARKNNGDWGTVTLNGSHGQGFVIVRYGHLNIQGGMQFKGIILVEGSVKICGNSNDGPSKIEGAVIGLGTGPNNQEAFGNQDQMICGAPEINYNSCVLEDLGKSAIDHQIWVPAVRPVFAWNELIR